MPLVKLCIDHGWRYLLRVCAEHTCRRFFHGKLEQTWKRFDHIVLKLGYRWYGRARVWQEETLDTYVSLYPPMGNASALMAWIAATGEYLTAGTALALRHAASGSQSCFFLRGAYHSRKRICGGALPCASKTAGILASSKQLYCLLVISVWERAFDSRIHLPSREAVRPSATRNSIGGCSKSGSKAASGPFFTEAPHGAEKSAPQPHAALPRRPIRVLPSNWSDGPRLFTGYGDDPGRLPRVGLFQADVRCTLHGRLVSTIHVNKWHTNSWYVRAFTRGNEVPRNAQTLFSWKSAKNRYRVVFCLSGWEPEMLLTSYLKNGGSIICFTPI